MCLRTAWCYWTGFWPQTAFIYEPGDDVFTGQMTQPTVSKHWRRVVSYKNRRSWTERRFQFVWVVLYTPELMYNSQCGSMCHVISPWKRTIGCSCVWDPSSVPWTSYSNVNYKYYCVIFVRGLKTVFIIRFTEVFVTYLGQTIFRKVLCVNSVFEGTRTLS